MESKSTFSISRFADVIVSAIALICLGPFLLLAALIIKLQDGGPVLDRQTVIGRLGKRFSLYRFRSMRLDAGKIRSELLHLGNADTAAFQMKHNIQTTPFGLFLTTYSLDELPRIFAVVAGDMSVLGPRPQLLEDAPSFAASENQSLSVKPGLISWPEKKRRA